MAASTLLVLGMVHCTKLVQLQKDGANLSSVTDAYNRMFPEPSLSTILLASGLPIQKW